MSNLLAIATVTETVRDLLDQAAKRAVPGASASKVHPATLENGAPPPGINAFLYQAVPNASLRNTDLPTRRDDATVVQRPRAAIDLHYLLSFYGDESRLEPQRLLGSALAALHSRPILTRPVVRATIDAAVAADPDHYLRDSDLAEQVETVKLWPLPLNLEEVSRLWSVLLQTKYALSVTYAASVVLIEGNEAPQPALPVRERHLFAIPFRHPVIEQALSADGRQEPIVPGSTLLLRGHELRSELIVVRIGQIEVTHAPENVTGTEIRVALTTPPFPAGALRAGVQGVQVLHPLKLGPTSVPLRGIESNVAAFVLRPRVLTATFAVAPGTPPIRTVSVDIEPIVGRSQRVTLLLNRLGGPGAHSFPARPRDADAGTVDFTITGVNPGNYLVRVQVDGAENPLVVDTDPASPTFNQFVDPKVTIA